MLWGVGQLMRLQQNAGVTSRTDGRTRGRARVVHLVHALSERAAACVRAASEGSNAAPPQQQQQPVQVEHLVDSVAGLAASGVPPAPACAALLDAVAHEACRQLSNRHSGAWHGFEPESAAALLRRYAALRYADGAHSMPMGRCGTFSRTSLLGWGGVVGVGWGECMALAHRARIPLLHSTAVATAAQGYCSCCCPCCNCRARILLLLLPPPVLQARRRASLTLLLAGLPSARAAVTCMLRPHLLSWLTLLLRFQHLDTAAWPRQSCWVL